MAPHAPSADSSRPSDVQVLAANIRIKADKRLGRETPSVIVALAKGEAVSEEDLTAAARQIPIGRGR